VYSAIILGTATRIGKPLGSVVEFARKHAARLQQVPVAYFVVGITMREDTAEHRRQAAAVLDPLCKIRTPVSEGLFAGRVEYARIEQPWRFLVSHDREGEMREGDWRDWDAIRAWTQNLLGALELENR
jgi:menaquinone-dependent protoporphyrinogen oxidase